MKHLLLAVCLTSWWSPEREQSTAKRAADVRAARFETLARLDAAVHYYHPLVATQQSAWDSLFAAHAPLALDAATPAAYHEQVQRMLHGLGDALTGVRLGNASTNWQVTTVNGVTRIVRGNGPTPRAIPANQPVIVDLRNASLPGELTSRWLGYHTPPTQHTLEYHGLPAATMQTSGGYGIFWREAPRASQQSMSTVARASRVILMVNQHSVLPTAVLEGLQDGRVMIVGIDTRTASLDGVTHELSLGEGTVAVVRRSKTASHGRAVNVDTTVASADADRTAQSLALLPPVASAMSIVQRGIDHGLTPARLPQNSSPQASVIFPAVGYRLLGAARTWSTYDHFSPYKHRFESPWSAVLANALPRVEKAGNALEYGQAVARIAAATNDGHSSFFSPGMSAQFMLGMPLPLHLQIVDGQLLIARLGPEVRDTTQLKRGDRILRIDGVTADSLMDRFRPYVAASTPQGRNYVLAQRVSGGLVGSTAILEVRGADGSQRRVPVRRATQFDAAKHNYRGGGIIRMLPGNIGYVDMERLPGDRIDSVYKVLSNASGIIFDMRGYPQGTGFRLAPWVARAQTPVATAHFDRPVRPSPDSTKSTVYPFDQTLPASPRPRFAGPTVMLIDEHAVSQSEHTAMMFKVLGGTTFVGSPTVGANGDVTNVVVPGRLTFYMTGQSVQWPDRKALQGVGVQPDIPIRPTARGLAQGIDEVLTAGYRHLGGKGDIAFSEDASVESFPSPPMRILATEPYPTSWRTGNGSPTSPYSVGIDTLTDGPVPGSPRGSLHLAFRSASSSFANAMQMISAEEFRGKRVSLSGYLRTSGIPVTSMGGVALWLRVDGSDHSMILDNMSTRQIKGTTPWTKVTITVDVPTTAMGLSLGVLFSGTGGEAWADELELTVVDAATPLTNAFRGQNEPESTSQMRAAYSSASRQILNPKFHVRP